MALPPHVGPFTLDVDTKPRFKQVILVSTDFDCSSPFLFSSVIFSNTKMKSGRLWQVHCRPNHLGCLKIATQVEAWEHMGRAPRCECWERFGHLASRSHGKSGFSTFFHHNCQHHCFHLAITELVCCPRLDGADGVRATQ